MGRLVHGIDVEDRGLVDLFFNADDLLVVVVGSVVPLALEFG